MIKIILLATVMKIVLVESQCPLQFQPPMKSNELATTSLVEALTRRSSFGIPVPVTPMENMVLCRNLAAQIECAALAKLKKNALKRQIFGQIAGPLLEELAKICRCPACQTSSSFLPSTPYFINSQPPLQNNQNFLYLNTLPTQSPNFNAKFSGY